MINIHFLNWRARDQTSDGCHQFRKACRLLDMHPVAESPAGIVVSGINDEWNFRFLHAGANFAAAAGGSCIIRDAGPQAVMSNPWQSIAQGAHANDLSTLIFEGLFEIGCEERLVRGNQDQTR